MATPPVTGDDADLSITCWVRPTAQASNPSIVWSLNDATLNSYFALVILNDTFAVLSQNASALIVHPIVGATVSNWFYIGVSRELINGGTQWEIRVVYQIDPGSTPVATFVGTYAHGASPDFTRFDLASIVTLLAYQGSVEALKMFDVPLSNEQLEAEAIRTRPIFDPVAWWPLVEPAWGFLDGHAHGTGPYNFGSALGEIAESDGVLFELDEPEPRFERDQLTALPPICPDPLLLLGGCLDPIIGSSPIDVVVGAGLLQLCGDLDPLIGSGPLDVILGAGEVQLCGGLTPFVGQSPVEAILGTGVLRLCGGELQPQTGIVAPLSSGTLCLTGGHLVPVFAGDALTVPISDGCLILSGELVPEIGQPTALPLSPMLSAATLELRSDGVCPLVGGPAISPLVGGCLALVSSPLCPSQGDPPLSVALGSGCLTLQPTALLPEITGTSTTATAQLDSGCLRLVADTLAGDIASQVTAQITAGELQLLSGGLCVDLGGDPVSADVGPGVLQLIGCALDPEVTAPVRLPVAPVICGGDLQLVSDGLQPSGSGGDRPPLDAWICGGVLQLQGSPLEGINVSRQIVEGFRLAIDANSITMTAPDSTLAIASNAGTTIAAAISSGAQLGVATAPTGVSIPGTNLGLSIDSDAFTLQRE